MTHLPIDVVVAAFNMVPVLLVVAVVAYFLRRRFFPQTTVHAYEMVPRSHHGNGADMDLERADRQLSIRAHAVAY